MQVPMYEGVTGQGLWTVDKAPGSARGLWLRGTYVLRVYTRRCVKREGERESKEIQESYIEIPPPK